MRALPPKVLRELRHVVLYGADNSNVEELVAAIDRCLKPKRSSSPAKARRVAKKATRREKVAELRTKVFARATEGADPIMPTCESGECPYPATDLEHFWSGADKRAMESLEGCWALCRGCHFLKHHSKPSRAFWLEAFLEHSTRHHYDAEPQRKARAELDNLLAEARP